MKVVRLVKICLNESYNKLRICKHLSDNFFLKNDLKKKRRNCKKVTGDWRRLSLLTKYYLGDEIKNEIGGEYGIGKKCIQDFGGAS